MATTNSTTMLDYYEVLMVPRSSSIEEIKRSYQQLIRKYHPDKLSRELSESEKSAATVKYHQISEAYNVLGDPKEKLEYDRKYDSKTIEQDFPISEVLDLSHMSYDPSTSCYSSLCRCGGSYMLTEADIAEGVDVVCCSTCTLCIQVFFHK